MLLISLWLLATAASAQTNPIHLQATPALVDLNAHTLTFELVNESNKVAVAYMLEFKQFDYSGKLIADSKVGWNHQSFKPTGSPPGPRDGEGQIQPGNSFTSDQPALPATVSAQVTVIAVVYDDRTYEGTEHDVFPLFDVRARNAHKLEQAAALMESYPATPEAFRSTIQAARALDTGRLNALLYEKLKLPLEVVMDNEHPLPAYVPTPNRQQWQAIRTALLDEAAFWTAEAQAVRP